MKTNKVPVDPFQPFQAVDPTYPAEPRHQGQLWTSAHSDLHSVQDWGPSKTVQSEAENCDINKIIERYGVQPPMLGEEGLFADFSDAPSFHEAQEIIAHANAQFMALDAKIRARFNNDPAAFLEFVNDVEGNADEMVKMGLLERKPAPEPTEPAKPVKAPVPKGKSPAPQPEPQDE